MRLSELAAFIILIFILFFWFMGMGVVALFLSVPFLFWIAPTGKPIDSKKIYVMPRKSHSWTMYKGWDDKA